MFAVIYRGYVKPDLEAQYQEYWKRIAYYFVTQRGALGSTLHKTSDGLWVAYSKWPDKATRDASWSSEKNTVNDNFPSEIQDAIIGLKLCLDLEKSFPEICMEIVEEVLNTHFEVLEISKSIKKK